MELATNERSRLGARGADVGSVLPALTAQPPQPLPPPPGPARACFGGQEEAGGGDEARVGGAEVSAQVELAPVDCGGAHHALAQQRLALDHHAARELLHVCSTGAHRGRGGAVDAQGSARQQAAAGAGRWRSQCTSASAPRGSSGAPTRGNRSGSGGSQVTK